MAQPLVSIKILAYNHEKYISQAIESCLMQKTSFPFELVVVDDFSKDHTPEIIQSYSDKNPGLIIPVLQKENQQSKRRQFSIDVVLKNCRGKYIAYCEGDDYWLDPYKLEKQVRLMEADPSISMCFTSIMREFEDGSKKPYIRRYHHGSCFFQPKDVILRLGGFADMVSTVVRKSIFNNIADWYYLSPVGDVPVYLLAMLNGKIFYKDEVMAAYRCRVQNSWTQKMDQDKHKKAEVMEKVIAMLNAFDIESQFMFHKYLQRRVNIHWINLMAFYSEDSSSKAAISPTLSFREKLEYQFFKIFKKRIFGDIYYGFLRRTRIY